MKETEEKDQKKQVEHKEQTAAEQDAAPAENQDDVFSPLESGPETALFWQ